MVISNLLKHPKQTGETTMAVFNDCAKLVSAETLAPATQAYIDAKFNGEDPLDIMLSMQRSLQIRLAQDKPEFNRNPNELVTAGDVLDWLRDQDDSIADETRELYTSLGGMSNGEKEATAVWKKWKARHGELRDVKIADMSPEDQLEIQFELVDQFHFFLNKLMALGFDSQTLFELYYLKNAENFARQDRGY